MFHSLDCARGRVSPGADTRCTASQPLGSDNSGSDICRQIMKYGEEGRSRDVATAPCFVPEGSVVTLTTAPQLLSFKKKIKKFYDEHCMVYPSFYVSCSCAICGRPMSWSLIIPNYNQYLTGTEWRNQGCILFKSMQNSAPSPVNKYASAACRWTLQKWERSSFACLSRWNVSEGGTLCRVFFPHSDVFSIPCQTYRSSKK